MIAKLKLRARPNLETEIVGVNSTSVYTVKRVTSLTQPHSEITTMSGESFTVQGSVEEIITLLNGAP